MSILTKLALAIGGLLFFLIVFVVCLAFIDYLESAHGKTVTHEPRRVPKKDFEARYGGNADADALQSPLSSYHRR
jgi:hypothetical protein